MVKKRCVGARTNFSLDFIRANRGKFQVTPISMNIGDRCFTEITTDDNKCVFLNRSIGACALDEKKMDCRKVK